MTQQQPKIGESPKFKNPPVVEVVMGVQFDPLDKLQAVHLGGFFSLWKNDYSKASDQPPIPPATEVFGDEVAGRKTLQISFGQPQAQIPRQWLVAPFKYASMVWATLFGFLVWGQLPDTWVLAGSGLVIGSGLYILHQETRGRRL